MATPWHSHWIDKAAGRVFQRPMMFSDGWGSIEAIEALLALGLPDDLEIDVRRATPQPTRFGWQCRLRFASPSAHPRLPAASLSAVGLWLSPSREPDPDRPLCVMLAASGEEGFGRRVRVGAGLVKEGAELILLENPFYGVRRPPGQQSSRVHRVFDQFLMNRTTVIEAVALLRWLRERREGPLAINGFSMGGYMAALAVGLGPPGVGAAICAAGLSAAPVYTEGELSRSVDWSALAPEVGSRQRARDRLRTLLESDAIQPGNFGDSGPAVIIGAERDGYVPAREVQALHDAWAGSRLKWLSGGHVAAYSYHDDEIRGAIRRAMRPSPRPA